jgi:hypothetical protein
MKSFSSVIVFLFIAAAVAKFTVPGAEKLKKLAAEKQSGDSLKITSMHAPGLVYSLGYLYYSKPRSTASNFSRLVGSTDPVSGKQTYQKDTTQRTAFTVLVPVKTERYLGLFGTYWKL